MQLLESTLPVDDEYVPALQATGAVDPDGQ
jgi:hypothetical protein